MEEIWEIFVEFYGLQLDKILQKKLRGILLIYLNAVHLLITFSYPSREFNDLLWLSVMWNWPRLILGIIFLSERNESLVSGMKCIVESIFIDLLLLIQNMDGPDLKWRTQQLDSVTKWTLMLLLDMMEWLWNTPHTFNFYPAHPTPNCNPNLNITP